MYRRLSTLSGDVFRDSLIRAYAAEPGQPSNEITGNADMLKARGNPRQNTEAQHQPGYESFVFYSARHRGKFDRRSISRKAFETGLVPTYWKYGEGSLHEKVAESDVCGCLLRSVISWIGCLTCPPSYQTDGGQEGKRMKVVKERHPLQPRILTSFQFSRMVLLQGRSVIEKFPSRVRPKAKHRAHGRGKSKL